LVCILEIEILAFSDPCRVMFVERKRSRLVQVALSSD
jgi:hypothetical protein